MLEDHARPVLSLAVAGRRLFSGSYDYTIKVWCLDTLTRLKTLTGAALRAARERASRLSLQAELRQAAGKLYLGAELLGCQGPTACAGAGTGKASAVSGR